MADHDVVSEQDWLAARRALLEREKALHRLQEQVTEGPKTLAELFDGRSQLVVYHFMYGPQMKTGCVGCSFLADHVDGANRHLKHHDVTLVAVSRAPLETLQAYKKRMGWKFPWVSSEGGDFNYDFHVSFTKGELAKGEVFYNFEMTKNETMEDLHGTSVFFKDKDGDVYHTYSAYARGDERSLGTYMWLDITPKGRDEGAGGNLTDWVRRHDEYEDAK